MGWSEYDNTDVKQLEWMYGRLIKQNNEERESIKKKNESLRQING